MKPKIAFFDFASCEGCQLAILNCEDVLLDLLELVDIVEFREALSEQAPRYDVAFIEGSIHREEDAARLRDIRARSRVLVAMGACADMGNVQARANFVAPAEHFARIYGAEARDRVQTDPEHWPLWAHTRVRRISEVVAVDFTLRGCPVLPDEFVGLLQALLQGTEPFVAPQAVCVACKLAGNVCVYESGEACMGQVVWGGCGAVCVTGGYRCDGCRGLLPGANLSAHVQILEDQGLDVDRIRDRYRLFCSGTTRGTIPEEVR